MTAAVVAKMKEMPTDDDLFARARSAPTAARFTGLSVRGEEAGRIEVSVGLLQAGLHIPADEAFIPLEKSVCSLVKKAELNDTALRDQDARRAIAGICCFRWWMTSTSACCSGTEHQGGMENNAAASVPTKSIQRPNIFACCFTCPARQLPLTRKITQVLQSSSRPAVALRHRIGAPHHGERASRRPRRDP